MGSASRSRKRGEYPRLAVKLCGVRTKMDMTGFIPAEETAHGTCCQTQTLLGLYVVMRRESNFCTSEPSYHDARNWGLIPGTMFLHRMIPAVLCFRTLEKISYDVRSLPSYQSRPGIQEDTMHSLERL